MHTFHYCVDLRIQTQNIREYTDIFTVYETTHNRRCVGQIT